MNLTVRQRAKVNAALSMIYASSPASVNAVIANAKTYQASGHDARKAYELALNLYAKDEPELGQTIGQVTRLIQASDDQTVARYDQAISAYIATGDETAINALAPMMAEDGQALAVSLGELTPEGLTNGDHPFAALATMQPSTGPQVPIPVGLPTIGLAPATPPGDAGNPEGQMSARTAQRWASVPVSGQRSAPSPFAGLTPQAAREAARSAAMGNGRAVLPVEAAAAPVIG